MIKLLEEIDELLAFLEDTAHGEEGKRITEMRYKILTEIDFLTQEQRTECSCPDDQCQLGDHQTCRWKEYSEGKTCL